MWKLFKSILILPVLLVCCKTSSKKSVFKKEACSVLTEASADNIVYEIVDEMPIYPGGNNEAIKFFMSNFEAPADDPFQGSILLTFIVNKDGSLYDIGIYKKTEREYTLTDKEGIRVIELMPNWLPGRCDDVAVRVRGGFPVRF